MAAIRTYPKGSMAYGKLKAARCLRNRILDPNASAVRCQQILAELKGIGSGDEAALWAHKAIASEKRTDHSRCAAR